MTKLANSYIQGIEGIIRQGQEVQIIRKDIDAGAAASLFLALIYGLTFLNYLTGLPKELLEHKGLFWDIYFRGIQRDNQKRKRSVSSTCCYWG